MVGVDYDIELGQDQAIIDDLRARTAERLATGVEAGFLRSDLDLEETARAINGLIYAGALASLRSGGFPAGYVDAALSLLLGGVTAGAGQRGGGRAWPAGHAQ